MKSAKKSSLFAIFLMSLFILSGCSHANLGGGCTVNCGGGNGPYTIGGTVSGLNGSGLVLQDNGADNLTINGNGSFTFKTSIARSQPYLVTVSVMPSSPAQTCTVSNGAGTALANVSTIVVTCSTGTVPIGVTVAGLTGTGLTLQDNGTDSLSIPTSGTYTFKTAIPAGQTYNVTVAQQPTTPAQTCTVTAGTGTATIGTAVNVQITCSLGTISIGGSVSGFAGGTGFVLQNNGGDNLTITSNGAFTFKTLVPAGATYKVTVFSQPSGPSQPPGCTVNNATGTANANITNISVVCPAVFHPIDVNVVGLLGANGAMQLLDNGGDNLMTPKNGAYKFATPIAHRSAYDVSIFVASGTQFEGCYRYGWSGTALSTPVSPIPLIDCGHNDWTWMDGTNVVDQFGKTPQAPPAPTLPNPPAPGILKLSPLSGLPGTPVTITGVNFGATQGTSTVTFNGISAGAAPNWSNTSITAIVPGGATSGPVVVTAGTLSSNSYAFTVPVCPPLVADTPGGSQYSSTWTDKSGNLWLLTGNGFTSTTSPPPSNFPGYFNELWEFTGTNNYGGGCGNNFWTLVTPSISGPSGRWGAITWTDPATGHLWLFGGQDGNLAFLNDLWEFTIGSKTWTYHGGGANVPGVYGGATPTPGGRWGASARLDASGSLWLFGGFGCDSSAACSNNLLNDLWKYSGGVWTFESGSPTGNSAGSYGTQGTTAAANEPPARQASVAWMDNTGNFWMFGGFTSGTNGFNDLWKFDTVTTKQWTWESGSKGATNTIGSYGTQGIAAATNVPSARWLSAAWSDVHGNLWLFGGQGYDSTGNGSLGDLWTYTLNTTTDPGNPATLALNQWTWIKGPNAVSQPGTYGFPPDSVAVWPNVGNFPGTRWAPSYWTTTPAQTGEQMFWMFGGEGFDATGSSGRFNLLNDLWRYLPYP